VGAKAGAGGAEASAGGAEAKSGDDVDPQGAVPCGTVNYVTHNPEEGCCFVNKEYFCDILPNGRHQVRLTRTTKACAVSDTAQDCEEGAGGLGIPYIPNAPTAV
jgi:hypothetical protein